MLVTGAASRAPVTLDEVAQAHGGMHSVGGGRIRGLPCPVCAGGTKDAFWVQEGSGGALLFGCNQCAPSGGVEFVRQVLVALGLREPATGATPKPKRKPLDTWTWVTADGRRRKQYRWPDGKKWSKPRDKRTPKQGELLYLRSDVHGDDGAVVYLCEGASSTDAVLGLGLLAIGRTGARPTTESLARLPAEWTYRVWPDNDPAGYEQAFTFGRALEALGRKVDAVNPLKLNPEAPHKFDPGDWRPASTAAAAAELDAAAVPLAAIEPKRPKRVTEPPSPAPHTDPDAEELAAVRALGDVVPLEFQELCVSELALGELCAKFAKKRLRYVRRDSSWLKWEADKGWTHVEIDTLRAAVMWCGEANYAREKSREGETEIIRDPKSGGRKSTAAGAIAALQGFVGSDPDDWDIQGNVAGLPGGKAIDLLTDETFDVTRDQLIRRRLGAAPCTLEEYEKSGLAGIVEHVIPDDEEREFVQRRLGAALVDAPAGDDVIWCFGPAGSGKGVFLQGVVAAFGDHAASIPSTEISAGGARAHLQWKHRLRGRRLIVLDDAPDRSLDLVGLGCSGSGGAFASSGGANRWWTVGEDVSAAGFSSAMVAAFIIRCAVRSGI